MGNVWKRYVKQWRYMRGCKSIQKHVKIYNISTPLPPSPPLLHIIQMFSILLHTLSINLHIFWPVLHIFVEWYVRMRDICGKFIKKLYQLRSEVLVEREPFQKRFLVLVHLEKKKNKTSRILLSKNDNKPKMYLSEFLYILYYFYESIGIMHCA